MLTALAPIYLAIVPPLLDEVHGFMLRKIASSFSYNTSQCMSCSSGGEYFNESRVDSSVRLNAILNSSSFNNSSSRIGFEAPWHLHDLLGCIQQCEDVGYIGQQFLIVLRLAQEFICNMQTADAKFIEFIEKVYE